MVSQSQAGELLTLLERIGTGSSSQVLVTEEVDSSKIKQQYTQQENEVDTNAVANGPCSNNTDMSIEDAELFSLCKEIQDLVDGPSNCLNDKDLDVVSLISSPGENSSTAIPNNKTRDISSSDPLSELFNILDSDSGFGSEDDNNDFSNAGSIEDDLLDLFPDLASV